jgi:phage FluMu protein Com
MAISIHCPQCGKKLNAPDSAAGKRARCPQCKTIVTLPVPSPDEVLDAEALDAPPPIGVQASPPRGYPPPPPLPMQDDFGDIPLANEVPLGAAPAAAPVETGPPRRPCPMCGEMIPVAAVQCRFCHEIFDPALKKAAAKKAKKDSFYGGEGDDLTGGEWLLAILCSGIGCIMGIIWMIQGKPKGKKMFGISLAFSVLWSVVRGIIESAAHNR